ncbi:MAG: hypothetical protein ACT4OG_09115 [Alphaproteobacteria bacterium]
MPDYRCYLMNGGHIIAAENIIAADDKDAIELCRAVFKARKGHCSGFEVWDRGRRVHHQEGGE